MSKSVGPHTASRVQALFLPEASDYVAGSASETIALAAPISQSPFVRGLQTEAQRNALPIHVGIHEPTTDRTRVKNVLIWIDAEGKISHSYQKLHLFDVDIPGGPQLRESDSVEPGSSICPPFESPLGRVGAMICFDLRFPALSSRLRDLGAEILTYPSAFTVPTGKAGHWKHLLQTRAIENQCYVIAAAQVGKHNEKRLSYGHSMIVDPWGSVMVEAPGDEAWAVDGEPSIIHAPIDLDMLTEVRRKMPLHPRTDVIELVERKA